MGSEHSLISKRVSDDGMALHLKNNYRPLHFHQVHGENVKLSKNKTVACRSEGFCKGIVFSDRPVKIEEPVYVKFLEISANWSGALRIGFTMLDPVMVKSKLPRYACPDLTSIQGNWAKAIAERMAKKDSVLYYYVDHNGDVHYGIDSEELGVFFGGVNTSSKLWAVLDIYGNTVSVEFVNPLSFSQENEIDAPSSNLTSQPQCIFHAPPFERNSSLVFHSVCGKHIDLRENRTIATRKANSNNFAYTFTENALKLEEQIIIELSQIGLKSNCSLIYGITSCNPSSLKPNELPENADDLVDRKEYWVVENDSNCYEVGDTIVYSISNQGEVTVMKNGNFKSAIFHVDNSLPLWLFFDLSGSVSEIILIGTSNYDSSPSDVCDKFERLNVSSLSNAQGIPGSSGQPTKSECVICYEEQVNCALYKCGHMCMCYGCASKMWNPGSTEKCPICREVIQDVIRIYR